jgi:membrane protein YqaA with SNARE-associated domain
MTESRRFFPPVAEVVRLWPSDPAPPNQSLTTSATGGPAQPGPSNSRWAWWAFAWGLAEATVFFIVPDVLITRIALRDFRRALLACLFALVGSLIGGTVLWLIADYDLGPRLLRFYTYLPGINGDLVAHTGESVLDHGVGAVASGTLRGEPYKLFAVHAGVQNVSLPLFLAVSAVVRLARFVFTASLAWLAARALRGHSPRVLIHLHALVWLAFYLIYLLAMQ